MDRFMRYTTGREPVLSTSVIAAVILGLVVLAAERFGITLTETELLLLGSVALVVAGIIGRHLAFSPETHAAEVDVALRTPVPDDDA